MMPLEEWPTLTLEALEDFLTRERLEASHTETHEAITGWATEPHNGYEAATCRVCPFGLAFIRSRGSNESDCGRERRCSNKQGFTI